MTQSLLSLTLYKERLEVPKWVWEQQETVSDNELIVDWLNRKHANLNIDKYCLSKDKDFIYFNIHPKYTPTLYVKDYNNTGVLFETQDGSCKYFHFRITQSMLGLVLKDKQHINPVIQLSIIDWLETYD